jgi:hypothetical protein
VSRLPRVVEQVLEDIAREHDHDQEMRDDPEAYLLSLLLKIREDIPKTWSTTRQTVDWGGFRKGIRKAREFLDQEAAQTPA